MRKSRENGLFLNVPDEQWNDWKWQVENRIETLEDLKKYITLTEEEEEGIKATLGRLRMATMAYPGGCEIGLRPIDLHLSALKRMGVRISEEGGMLRCDGRDMHAADIHLDYPSVGATENIIMAATLLPGRTTISNAAREPEIEDLQHCINTMGGCVQGAGSPLIVIEGVRRLHGVTYQPMPDRIAAGTYLCAAAITGGQIELTNARPRDLTAVLDKLRAMGCVIAEGEQALYLSAPGNVLYYKNKKSVRFLRPALKALRTTR